jgi:hypothetical protein
MGCFDIYCFICGNACRSSNWIEFFNESIQKKIKMDIYNKILNKMKWLNKCTMLLDNDKIVHNCEEINCNNVFEGKNKTYISSNNPKDGKTYDGIGIFLHTDCWYYVKNTYGIELTYSQLSIKLNKLNKINIEPIKGIKYRYIENYWGQDTRYDKMFLDRNIWMAYSPLYEERNKDRIKKIIIQLKIK